ncbi:MAG: transglycosylase SLT domain-containing protein [Ignavibacteriales bacterium]
MINKLFFIIIIILFAFNSSCDFNPKENYSFDFDNIVKRGKIVAVTASNAYGYYVYRGQTAGFNYDLLQKLSKELGIEIEIKVVSNIQEMYKLLESGEADIIAFNLLHQDNESVAYTDKIYSTSLSLVQRKSAKDENSIQFINSVDDLPGKTIYLRSNAGYEKLLNKISLNLGSKIYSQEANINLSLEDLIQMVAEGDIDYAVAEKNIAELNQAYYYNIEIGPEISENEYISWAVRSSDKKLLAVINNWLKDFTKKREFKIIYAKYFGNKTGYRNRLISEFTTKSKGKISHYDDLFKKYAENLDWDWRLLASLVYQESNFNAGVVSRAGAAGLMQMMPETAEKFGAENPLDPVESMEAGVAYLVYLNKLWKKSVADPKERIKFILASYNIGPGHIIDAAKLAEKNKAKPDVWENNVEKYLLLKSNPKFNNDEVVKNGYALGYETVRFVKEILERFEHYKQVK